MPLVSLFVSDFLMYHHSVSVFTHFEYPFWVVTGRYTLALFCICRDLPYPHLGWFGTLGLVKERQAFSTSSQRCFVVYPFRVFRIVIYFRLPKKTIVIYFDHFRLLRPRPALLSLKPYPIVPQSVLAPLLTSFLKNICYYSANCFLAFCFLSPCKVSPSALRQSPDLSALRLFCTHFGYIRRVTRVPPSVFLTPLFLFWVVSQRYACPPYVHVPIIFTFLGAVRCALFLSIGSRLLRFDTISPNVSALLWSTISSCTQNGYNGDYCLSLFFFCSIIHVTRISCRRINVRDWHGNFDRISKTIEQSPTISHTIVSPRMIGKTRGASVMLSTHKK